MRVVAQHWAKRIFVMLFALLFSSLALASAKKSSPIDCTSLSSDAAQDSKLVRAQTSVSKISLVNFSQGSELKDVQQGQGGLIISSLTQGVSEPLSSVYDHQEKPVTNVQTGVVLGLDPGCYLVEIGSGRQNQLVHVPVYIEAGTVSQIEPSWGALVIHTIDEEETPFRGQYLLFEFLTRDDYGFGQGADEELGEQVNSWLLKPGFYKVVGPLENVDANRNFAVVEIKKGEVQHHVIAMNRSSGDFLGAGVLPNGDFTVRGSISGRPSRVQTGGFKIKARVGGDFSQNASDDAVGLGGNSLGFGLFTDFSANYLHKKHFFNLFLDLEGGVRKNSDENFVRKVRDEISLSTIYIHHTWPMVGGYLRMQATSQFADSILRFDDDRNVIVDQQLPQLVSDITVSTTLDPLLLEQGLGANFRLLKKTYLDLDARTGFSMRETVTSGFLVDNDDDSTGEFELSTVNSSFDVGWEWVFIGTARFAQKVSYQIDANIFMTPSQYTLRINNTMSLRITSSFSIGLLVGIRRDDTTNEEVNFNEALFVRASRQVF